MSKDASYIAKGIAIVMMLWHHLFFSVEAVSELSGGAAISYWPFSESMVFAIGQACKVCVAVFVFITGYGTYLKVAKLDERGGATAMAISSMSIASYVKLLLSLWAILVPLEIIGLVTGLRSPFVVYGSGGTANGVLAFVFDLLGLSHAMGTPTFNATWWYLSMAALFTLALPSVVLLARKVGSLPLLACAVLVPGLGGAASSNLTYYVPVVLLGVASAQYRFFEMSERYWKSAAGLAGGLIVLGVVLCLRSRMGATWLMDLIASVDVCWVGCSLTSLPHSILTQLGSHSANIFLFHTFIHYYYLPVPTYSIGSAMMILILDLVACVAISAALEYIKYAVGLQTLGQRLIELVSSSFNHE